MQTPTQASQTGASAPGQPEPDQGAQAASAKAPAFGELDLLPDIILPDQNSSMVQLSFELIGKKLLLLFCPDPRLSSCRALLHEFAGHFEELDPFVNIYVVTASEPQSNRSAMETTALPFPLLSDLQRQVAGGLGVGHNLVPPVGDGTGAFTLVVADENRRVLKINRNLSGPGQAEALLDFLRAQPRPEPRNLGRFAPVLYVPRVLEPEFCQQLIAAYEGGDPEIGRAYRHGGDGGGEHIVDPAFKVRRDFYVTDPALLEELRRRMVRRLIPEIAKALTRQVAGSEEFKVVCYDAVEGGHFRAHRDNVSKHHAHRRFAMTLNLNSEAYEGGALRFPEYGPDLYAPDSGDAVIFSCSLLHEAMPVTKGRRFVLLSFFYDEESRQLSERFRRPEKPGAAI